MCRKQILLFLLKYSVKIYKKYHVRFLFCPKTSLKILWKCKCGSNFCASLHENLFYSCHDSWNSFVEDSMWASPPCSVTSKQQEWHSGSLAFFSLSPPLDSVRIKTSRRFFHLAQRLREDKATWIFQGLKGRKTTCQGSLVRSKNHQHTHVTV